MSMMLLTDRCGDLVYSMLVVVVDSLITLLCGLLAFILVRMYLAYLCYIVIIVSILLCRVLFLLSVPHVASAESIT